MYPHEELIRLGAHKAALRRRIGRGRETCTSAANGALRPFAWLNRLLALWQRVPPLARLAAMLLGLLVQRTVAPRSRWLGWLVRWAPLVLGVVRGLTATRRR